MVMAYLFRVMAALAPLVPRPFGLWLFGLPAPIVARLASSRHAVRDNLRHVVGPAATAGEMQELVTGVYRHQLMNYYDLFLGPSLSRDDIERYVRVVDLEALVDALRSPEGCVVVAPHLGNLDLSSRAFATVGMEGLAVVEHLGSDALFEVVCDLRRQDGLEMVAADRAAMAIFKALRRGRAVFLAADRDTTDSSVSVEFFGTPTRLPDGYAQVVRRTGARLVVATASRLPDGMLEIHSALLPPVPVTDDQEGDVLEIMRPVLAYIERRIQLSPDQWVLFSRIWQETP